MSKVEIGRIVNTCGLKGEVKVISSSDFIKDRFKKGNIINVYNKDKNIDVNYNVVSYRKNDKFLYVKFSEVNTIEEAEKLKESSLLIDSESLPKLDKDSFYYYELLDMEVYYNESKIGVISEISDNTRQSLIRVKGEKEFLVPFIDEFIESIDTENKKITLKNIEGLL